MPMIRPVSPFAAATLLPVPLLLAGGLFGGIFILAALLYLVVFTLIFDALIRTAGTGAAPGSEFPAAGQLSVALGGLHFLLLPVAVAGISGAAWLGFWEGLAALLAFGLYFGQVSNSNAHELIHRSDKRLFNLGKWVLISLLYGHHVTAHLRIHHRFVATPEDPNSARLGESFYAFAPRAWIGAFQAGWEIENSISEMKGRRLPFWRHPYAEYVAGALGFAILSILAFGLSGLIAYLLLASYAQVQLLLSDYVQHYGLRRRKLDDERREPVAPWHSWNAAHWLTGGLMLNAPRHSEHHIHPAKPYPELSLPAHMEGPRLPYSLPLMGAIALVPPLWRRLMDRRARAWQARIDAGEISRTAPPSLLRAPRKARPAAAAPAAGDDAPVLAAVAAAAAEPVAEARPGARAAAAGEAGARPERIVADAPGATGPDAAESRAPRSAPGADRRDGTGAAAGETGATMGEKGAVPATQFVRSSALIHEGSAPDEGDLSDAGEEPALAAIRQLTGLGDPGSGAGSMAAPAPVARGRPEEQGNGNRRRFDFPVLEPADGPPEPKPEERRRALLRGAGLAARSLAALLSGAPPSGPRD